MQQQLACERAGLPLLRLSSKGMKPLRSWKAITPADHRSLAGKNSESRFSGARNHGVPSRPRSVRGSWPGSKNTARPKSASELRLLSSQE